MAVLWRSMEASTADEGYQDDTAVLPNKLQSRNTFFEKHVRISETLPSQTQMKTEVKRVFVDRNQSPKTKVVGGRGIRPKADVYGISKASGSSMLFTTLKGFLQTNAYIERNISKDSGAAHVPILGGGIVVSWDDAAKVYTVVDAGYMVLGIRVGKQAFVEMGSSPYAASQDLGDNMQSRVVYHFDKAVSGS